MKISDRDDAVKALLSGQRIRLPFKSGDNKRLAICIDNIRKEVAASPERIAREAIAIGLMPVPLASNGYQAQDRIEFEDLKSTLGRGGAGLDADRCACCDGVLLPVSMAEPNTPILLMASRPTYASAGAAATLCLECMIDRFAFSGGRVARWFVEQVFGPGIASLVRLPPPSENRVTGFFVDPRIRHWQEQCASRQSAFRRVGQ